MQLVEIKPLKPFAGSYRCALSEADVIDDGLVEKEGGMIVKEKVPRKRYRGVIPVKRAATPDEYQLWKDGRLPDHLQASEDGRFVTVMPKDPTVKVPPEIADSLVARGLGVRVNQAKVKPSL